MSFVHTDWWSLDLPDDWLIEHDESTGAVSISDPDELGCIDLLVIRTDDSSDLSSNGLKLLAEAALEGAEDITGPDEGVVVGQFAGVVSRFTDDGSAWREWYLAGEDFVLVVSHNTDVEHSGLDDGIVDDILSTLVVETQ